jgi:hypothetical protein
MTTTTHNHRSTQGIGPALGERIKTFHSYHVKVRTLLKALWTAGIHPAPGATKDDGLYDSEDPCVTLHPRLDIQVALYDGTYILNAYQLDADGNIKAMMQMGTDSSAKGIVAQAVACLARLENSSCKL